MTRVIIFNVLLSIVICIYSPSDINSQVYKKSTFITRDVKIRKDSIFEVFVPPVINFKTYVRNFNDCKENPKDSSECEGTPFNFVVFCNIVVNYDGSVRYLYKQPLYGFGGVGGFQDTSIVWKELLRSIDSVSKFWKFKPVLNQIQDSYAKEFKKFLQELNEKILRENNVLSPYIGLRQYSILLNIFFPTGNSSEESFVPDFLYWIETEPN